MSQDKVTIQYISEEQSAFKLATSGSVGYDVRANEDCVIEPQTCRAVSTGLRVSLPNGVFLSVRGRSGVALKNLIMVHHGTIDSDYTGEIKIIIQNFSVSAPFEVKKGDRIAQLIVERMVVAEFEECDSVKENTHGGFGSTGMQ